MLGQYIIISSATQWAFKYVGIEQPVT